MSSLIAWHVGSDHPAELALTLALAFGPFLVLGIVILVRRRADRLEDDQEQRDGG